MPPAVIRNALDLLTESQQEFSLPVQGNSMLPLIRAGDLLLVKQSATVPQRGEVWAFRRDDQLIAHRVHEILSAPAGSPRYLAQGDHALASDPFFSQDQVVGKVIAIRRGERQMRLDLASWQAAERIIRLAMIGRGKFDHSQSEDRRMTGAKLRRIIDRLRLSGFSLLLRVLEMLFGRWEQGN